MRYILQEDSPMNRFKPPPLDDVDDVPELAQPHGFLVSLDGTSQPVVAEDSDPLPPDSQAAAHSEGQAAKLGGFSKVCL